jgi:pSer/pThr/pTyr-binding forkhead associated (FHA) protein
MTHLGQFEVRTPTGSFVYKIDTSLTEVKVGRSPDGNDIVVSDSECSRWHMRFDIVRGELMAYDLSSANGTYVGERRIDGGFGQKICDKDVVVIGVSQLKFVASARKPTKVASKQSNRPASYKNNRVKSAGGNNKHANKLERDLNKAKQGVGARAAGNAGHDNAALKVEVIQKIKPRGKMTYEQMVDMWREDNDDTLSNRGSEGCIMVPNARIRVVVRKRPLGKKESNCYDIASTVCSKSQQAVVIHEPKEAVDLTKYIDNHMFQFDQVLNEEVNNRSVYYCTAYPLIPFVFKGRNATCFAYGQTGSGKTFTMAGEGREIGIYHMAAADIFKLRAESYPELMISASFFEIYGGQVYDLLNNRARLLVQEDGRQQVCVTGLTEFAMESVEEVLSMINEGNNVRRTGATSANDTSSRSHAIMQFVLRKKGRYKNPVVGKLSIIDLAGSERGKDTAAMDRRRRMEGAEINKSLLALKECIRALSVKQRHTPFRASKLTQVLKDSFIGKSRNVMIATISPASMNAEHTCNTLRYADRVKELSKKGKKKERRSPRLCRISG